MSEYLKKAWLRNFLFFRGLRFSDFFLLLLFHVFIAWNGVQFFLKPTLLSYLIDDYSILQNVKIIMDNQMSFIPLFVFILLTLVFIYFLIRIFFDISFYGMFKKRVISLKNKFIIIINFSMPSLFHNLGFLFILSSLYLVFILIYILLIVMNIRIAFDFYGFIKYSALFYFLGILLFNLIISDFVLPELIREGSFSHSLKKFYAYFLQNKSNIIFYYSFKLCIISLNILILVYFYKYIFLKAPFFHLAISTGLMTNLVNTFSLFASLLISLIINSFFVLFFNVFCYSLRDIMFKDFHRFKYSIALIKKND